MPEITPQLGHFSFLEVLLLFIFVGCAGENIPPKSTCIWLGISESALWEIDLTQQLNPNQNEVCMHVSERACMYNFNCWESALAAWRKHSGCGNLVVLLGGLKGVFLSSGEEHGRGPWDDYGLEADCITISAVKMVVISLSESVERRRGRRTKSASWCSSGLGWCKVFWDLLRNHSIQLWSQMVTFTNV